MPGERIRRVRVVWTVEYETDYEPTDLRKIDEAVEELMAHAPGTIVIRDIDENEECMEAVGWKVDHPEWGDMSVGTLAQPGRSRYRLDTAPPSFTEAHFDPDLLS